MKLDLTYAALEDLRSIRIYTLDALGGRTGAGLFESALG